MLGEGVETSLADAQVDDDVRVDDQHASSATGAGFAEEGDDVRHRLAVEHPVPAGGKRDHVALRGPVEVALADHVMRADALGAKPARADPTADRRGVATDAAGCLRHGEHEGEFYGLARRRTGAGNAAGLTLRAEGFWSGAHTGVRDPVDDLRPGAVPCRRSQVRIPSAWSEPPLGATPAPVAC